MNLLEKYKAMVQAQKEPPHSLVLNNTTSTEKDIPARIILNAITPIEEGLKKQPGPAVAIVEPAANAKTTWMPEIQTLINWFMELETPTEPFYLEPHLHIIHPAKFFSSIWREIQTGPKGPRARMGTLQSDLRMLKARLN